MTSLGSFGSLFDHRLLDGALADQFMGKLKAVLEGWSEAVVFADESA